MSEYINVFSGVEKKVVWTENTTVHVVLMEKDGATGATTIFPGREGVFEFHVINVQIAFPVKISMQYNRCLLISAEGKPFKLPNGRAASSVDLLQNPVLQMECDGKLYFIIAETEEGDSEYYTKYRFDGPGEFVIGKSKDCDIQVEMEYISRKHAILINDGKRLKIQDCGSSNGTYVNGYVCKDTYLKAKDTIYIPGLFIVVEADGIMIGCSSKIKINNKKLKEIRPEQTPQTIISTKLLTKALDPAKTSTTAETLLEKYRFKPAPRLVKPIRERLIDMEKPPTSASAPEYNWMSILLAPMISVVLMLVLVFALGMSPIMLIMSGSMSVISIITATVNYKKQKKKHVGTTNKIDVTYRAYLDKIKTQLKEAHSQQLTRLLSDNPAPNRWPDIAKKKENPLWERTIGDEDFLNARLGLGSITASVRAIYKRPEVVVEESELERQAVTIATNSIVIDNAPILADFYHNKQTGMLGNREATMMICRNVLTELSGLHTPGDVKIVALINENEAEKWKWLRWLPHCADENRKHIYFYTDAEAAKEPLDEIYDILGRRDNLAEDSYGEKKQELPHFLFVVANPQIIEKHPVRKMIYSDAMIGCSAIFLAPSLSALPQCCMQIIEADVEEGRIYKRNDAANDRAFATDKFTLSQADEYARGLAPIFVESDGAGKTLPNVVTFLEGYGVETPDQLEITKRWANAETYNSLAVPIAVAAGDSSFCFDIHEKRHGVNGIVAGMPGSGKTEMVQSWLLSLAVNYSPEDVNFVLIDFKGTGLIAPFKGLPHIAGTISNLDTDINRNLLALQNEVHRREQIIDKYSSYGVKNINSMNKSYAGGLIPEKLPILLVVIDEYAEFKKIYPDFGKEIDSLTSKGRALGIFVVLMTQKPAGVVSAKSEDNIKFRWCLRVANYSASKEMLGRNDAAKIQNSGRAFIKVGEDDVYEEVQSFWSGAPYDPSKHEKKTIENPIALVHTDGSRTLCETVAKKTSKEIGINEIDAVVDYIAEYCKKTGIPEAMKVWTEKLPNMVALTDLLVDEYNGIEWPKNRNTEITIGIADDPASQSQYAACINPVVQGHTAIYGGPVSGKTTLLKTIAMSIAMTNQPDEASIYCMDFGGWNLNSIKDLPHVGGIVFDQDANRLGKLCMLLNDILNERKELFAGAGVGNIASYRKTPGAKHLPDVYLLIDGMHSLMKMYPELDTFFINYTGNGLNYGMYLIATTNTPYGIPMKIAANIRHAVVLQMVDKNDYTYLAGKTTISLAAISGRGFLKGNPPLEFQAAMPTPGDDDSVVTRNIANVAKVMNACWSGSLPDEIPDMPEIVEYRSWKKPGVMLGLSTDRVKPVLWDYEKQHYFMISGTPESGKSNLLKVIAKQMSEKEEARIIAFDIKGSGLKELKAIADTYQTTAAEMDAYVESLRPEMQRRYERKQQGQEINDTPIVLVVDDFDTFFDAVSNDTMLRLQAIVRIGAGLGLYLIAAGDSYRVASLCYKSEPVTTGMLKGKCAAMMGGCMKDHSAITVKGVSHNKMDEEIRKFEGYYVEKSEIVGMKAMKF